MMARLSDLGVLSLASNPPFRPIRQGTVMSTPQARRGFTLLVLLVLIAIIAVLIGLLLPAVQTVREAAARAKCQNNLKQMSLATMNYEGIKGVLPGGSATAVGYFSPAAQVLPYIEQSALYQQFDLTAGPFDSINPTAAAQRPPLFICPSEQNLNTLTPMGWGNYHANCGTWVFVVGTWDGPFGPPVGDTANTEALPGNAAPIKSVRFLDITDGTSNTAMYGEVVNGLYDPTPPPSRIADCFTAGSITTASLPAAHAALQAMNWQTAGIVTGTWRFRGYPWSEGSAWRGGTTTCCRPTARAGGRAVGGPSLARPAVITQAA